MEQKKETTKKMTAELLFSQKQKAKKERNAALLADYSTMMEVPGQCIGEVHKRLMRKYHVKRGTIYRILNSKN